MPKPDPDDAPRFLLDFLVAHHPALFAVDELVREFAGATNDDLARTLVDEGVVQLVVHGLAHRLDGYVFASYAAVRAHELRASN